MALHSRGDNPGLRDGLVKMLAAAELVTITERRVPRYHRR